MVISLVVGTAQMSEKTDCPLCSKTLTYAGLNKHMFSKNHSHIWNAPSNRVKFQNCFNSGAKNTIEMKMIFLCFGCKTFTRKDVPHSCPNKAKTLEFIKSILDVPVRIPEPKLEPQGPLLMPQADPNEIDKLKKEIVQLKDELFEADGKNEKAEEFLDALKFWIRFVKSENQELYETIMNNFKEEGYSSTLECLKIS